MKKLELKKIIKEVILSKAQYRGKFLVKQSLDNTIKDWKRYIEKIPGVKIFVYPSAYKHYIIVDIIAPDKATVSKIIKQWRQYNINWPEENDFEPISLYSKFLIKLKGNKMPEKINLKEDRDFFTREFRKNVLNENTGEYLSNILDSLRQTFENLPKQLKYITQNDIIKLNKALNELEKTIYQVLKDKGLSG